jgi:hypothetical protein
VNGGRVTIQDLVVQFPSSSITVGSVAAGATTGYAPAPKGVYSYAAYRFVAGGVTINQPVVDWVGEQPLEGTKFTYTVAQATAPSGGPRIQLLQVTRDE